MSSSKKTDFLAEIQTLHNKYLHSKNIGPNYYEPGSMEYLDKYEGIYDQATGEWLIRVEVKGTRYEDRTELIENINEADKIKIVREKNNPYNNNNFYVASEKDKNLGSLPATLCNALAPLFDKGQISFADSFVSYVEPISKRSRHATKAILFVEIHGGCVAELIAEEPVNFVVEKEAEPTVGEEASAPEPEATSANEKEAVSAVGEEASAPEPEATSANEKEAVSAVGEEPSAESSEEKKAKEESKSKAEDDTKVKNKSDKNTTDDTGNKDDAADKNNAHKSAKPAAIYIRSFKLKDKVGLSDFVFDKLNAKVTAISNFHNGSEFDASSIITNPRAPKNYTITIENAPDETKTKEKIRKMITALEEFIKKVNFSNYVLTAGVKKKITSESEKVINKIWHTQVGRKVVSINMLAEMIPCAARDYIVPAIDSFLSKTIGVPVTSMDYSKLKEKNTWLGQLYEICESALLSNVYQQLYHAIEEILGIKNINVYGDVDARLLTPPIIKKIIEAYFNIIQELFNREILSILNEILSILKELIIASTVEFVRDMYKLLKAFGKDGDRIIEKIHKIEDEIKSLHIRGFFNATSGIHLYWDRICQCVKGFNTNESIDLCVKVAAHEMEHAWHYADIVSMNGVWDDKQVPESSWVQETVAEYFALRYCIQDRNYFGADFIRQERNIHHFPYDGGYSGALIVKEKVRNKGFDFAKTYELSLTDMVKAYAEIAR